MQLKFLFPTMLALAVLPCRSEQAVEATTEKSYILVSKSLELVPGLKTITSEVMTVEGGEFSIESPQGAIEGTMSMKTIKEIEAHHLTGTKIAATIVASNSEQKMVMNGQEIPQPPQVQPLVGVPLLVTLGEGVWKAAKEDGAAINMVEQQELANIEKGLSGVEDRNVYGTEARKPGDTWTVAAKDMSMVQTSDDVEGDVKMTFDKVGDYKGAECAFLTGRINVKGSPPSGGGVAGGKMEMAGTFKVIRSLKHQIDLSREMKGTMEIEMKSPAGTMRMGGPTSIKKTVLISE